jgi:class 3 adenylate cyclase
MHQPVLYGSAACGADIIVIEAALALGVEVNVVMPFAAADFVRTSVAVGGESWVRRFDTAMARVTRIIAATDESYLGDDILFEHAARLVEGLTVLRAAQLNATPRLLCVIDATSGGEVGGTASAFDRWRDAIGPVDLVDVAALRRDAALGRASGDPAASVAAPLPGPANDALAMLTRTPDAKSVPEAASHSAEPATTGANPRPPRTLRTLLFADFAGYGRLQDVNAAMFQEEFWAVAARLIAASPVPPRFANTGGDGLYLVFDTAHDGVAFALQLSEGMRSVDWARLGMGSSNPIRICLHTGPVFCAFDPVIGRDNYFGSSVTRAARIEPVTPPGTVFVSETCAATLAATGQRDFLLEYVGSVELAKGAGATRVYQVVAAQPRGN